LPDDIRGRDEFADENVKSNVIFMDIVRMSYGNFEILPDGIVFATYL
jgi:hypothetical protein